MNRLTILVLLSLLSSSCESEKPKTRTKGVKTTSQLNNKKIIPQTFYQYDSSKAYSEVKREIQSLLVSRAIKQLDQDSISKLFTHALLHEIIPYWYGTPWGFEGHTATPKKGTIACGYFVSTTLRDVGLQINRYKLAQQSPINEAKSLGLGDSVLVVASDTLENIIPLMYQNIEHGIHFLGFGDTHVGFIVRNEFGIYIIHSNFEGTNGVQVESIEKSNAFAYFNLFYVVPLSTNKKLLKRWINREDVKVVMPDDV